MSDEKPDPNKLAVALEYERGTLGAPTVSAKGKGYIAEQIIKLAREHGIEVRQDTDLAALLSTLEIGEMIPTEAYVAVAEILSYIYGKNAKVKQGVPHE